MKYGSNKVIETANLTSALNNHDYDGDSFSVMALHSNEGKADFKYAYVKNLIEFEHMDKLLVDYEHESIFASYMLTLQAQKLRSTEVIRIKRLTDLKRSIITLTNNPGQLYYIEEYDETLTYTEWLIEYSFIGEIKMHMLSSYMEPDLFKGRVFYSIERDGLLDKKNLMTLTNKYHLLLKDLNTYGAGLNFWDGIHEWDKFLLECGGSISGCIPSFNLKDFSISDPEILKYKQNLISVEPFIAFHQNMVLFKKIMFLVDTNESNILNLVYKSGARLKSVQLLKAASNTGIPTDIYGKAFPINVKNSLLDGLTPYEYFSISDSSRLALDQRQSAIPKAGELQRKFFFTTGITKLDKSNDDCGTTNLFTITVKNKIHLELLNHKFMQGETGLVKIDPTDLSLIGKEIKVRSPITCTSPNYTICKKCFGTKLPDSVNLGALVGSGISEGIIQSVLRTHHFSGAYMAPEDKELTLLLEKCEIRSPNILISDSETLTQIISKTNDYYENTNDIEFEVLTSTDIEFDDSKLEAVRIKVHNLPFNDDSVKILNSIVSLIDKNRKGNDLIQPAELYNRLIHVIDQNGILSTYLEIILSLLYYDEDEVLLRYTDKPVVTQVALKNIIEMLDPKLSIFYNFSNRVISKVYSKHVTNNVSHMYDDLMDIYK